MQEEKVKDVFIQIRVSKELRDKFKAVCKSKAINSSELLRQYIQQWTYDNSSTNSTTGN